MTFYDDAELAAIGLLRLALAETDDRTITNPVHDLVSERFRVVGDRVDATLVSALVVALARQYSSAMVAIAGFRDQPVDEVVDDFEQSKLRQIVDDLDGE